MKLEMERLIKQRKDETFINRGSFNCQVEFLGPQRMDEGGTMTVVLMKELDVVLLNSDTECKGTNTWGNEKSKGVIDFAMVNMKMYSKFTGMETEEEEQQAMNISDHNMVT